jgi:YidC/Oxa1 family membrane protein insertase
LPPAQLKHKLRSTVYKTLSKTTSLAAAPLSDADLYLGPYWHRCLVTSPVRAAATADDWPPWEKKRMLEFFQNLFSPITTILGGVLTFFYGYGVPWWLSIVFLTIIVRIVLFPLTAKQIRSMRAMQELKPEIDRIRDEHREDPQRMQQEMMRLYRDLNVNPLGSCLPVLLQVPVFIGIFYVILEFGGSAGMIGGTDQLGTQPTFAQGGVLWFTDLTARDPYFILPVLSSVTMLLSMEMTTRNVEPKQRWLMRVLPFAFLVITWTFPVGLFVYWIANNLITMAQNYVMYNFDNYGPGRSTSTS